MAKVKETAAQQVLPASYVPSLKKAYKEEIVGKLMEQFGYSTVMQCPRLVKITLNEGVGSGTQDKQIVEYSFSDLSLLTCQLSVLTASI